MEKVGKDGVVTVEESQGLKLDKEYVEGMQLDRGYLSAYFVTSADGGKMEASLDQPYVLVTDKKISAVADILPTLEKVVTTGRPLLIIAEDVDGEALPTLVVNKMRGTHQRARRQGPGLRRSPQGDARGHRDPDRRAGHLRGGRPQARQRPARGSRRGASRDRHQGHHHDRRGQGLRGARSRPAWADQAPDRGHHQRLRPREAPGAARQALRRRGRPQGRRGHRGRAQGEEAPHRGRPVRGPCRLSRRAWSPVAARSSSTPPRRSTRSRSLGDEAIGVNILRRALEEPLRQIAVNAAMEGSVVVDAVRKLQPGQRLRRPEGRVHRPVRDRASSIRPR